MNSIPAGLLGTRVTIQSKSVTRDSYGAEVVSWSNVATEWMQVEPLSGRERVAMRQAQSEITTRFRCRYRTGITTAHRLMVGSQPYNITEVIDTGGDGAVLELLGFADAVAT